MVHGCLDDKKEVELSNLQQLLINSDILGYPKGKWIWLWSSAVSEDRHQLF